MRRAPADALRALAGMAIAASPPRLSTHPGRFLAVLRPPSRSSLTTNPHSAAASRGPTSRDFLPWRFLDACQLSVPSASFLPASKNLHMKSLPARKLSGRQGSDSGRSQINRRLLLCFADQALRDARPVGSAPHLASLEHSHRMKVKAQPMVNSVAVASASTIVQKLSR